MYNKACGVELDSEALNSLRTSFPRGAVAFDIEATGLSPLIDKIVEIAAVKVTSEGEVETFQSLVNPGVPIPPDSSAVHGITDEEVADRPTIAEVLPAWHAFVEDLPLIAHNASFDGGFIIFNMGVCEMSPPLNKLFCSIKMARCAFAASPGYALSTLCENLDIPLDRHHRALDDAIACLLVAAKALESASSVEQVWSKSFMFSFDEFRQNSSMAVPEKLQGIIRAIEEGRKLEIVYSGGSHRGEFRPIRPVSLMPMPKYNVLYAHCLLSDLYKSFILHKISDFRPLAD